jgi:hypothetical protein
MCHERRDEARNCRVMNVYLIFYELIDYEDGYNSYYVIVDFDVHGVGIGGMCPHLVEHV